MHKHTIIFILLVSFHFFGYSQEQLDSAKQKQKETYRQFRIGSYGELLFQHMDYSPNRYNYPDGAPKQNRASIGIPRMNLSFDYRLSPSITISSEIEFEWGGTGSETELEYDEAGEYENEVEKGGEVALEQFHITKSFSNKFNIRAGHIIVPVGLTNPYHIPTEFFGSIRPEGEKTLIPLTWHETGISFFGQIQKWHYEFQVVNGLDANGFSSEYWISTGKQGKFENTKITQPAFVGRIENSSIPNLRWSVSGYWGNSSKNTEKPEKMAGLNGTVSILSTDLQYKTDDLAVRANVLTGHLSDSYQISAINKNLPEASQYKRTPVASNALSYSIEAGYNVLPLFHLPTRDKLFPFLRYEYYNSMEKTANGILADKRFERDVITAGLNYFPVQNLAIKADFSHRILGKGNYNNENTFGIALVYTAWFFQK